MQFLKLKDANLPESVSEDTIIFTDSGSIYVNKSDGTLRKMLGGSSSSDTGSSIDGTILADILYRLSDVEVALSNVETAVTKVDSILTSETSTFYRPKLVSVPGEDIEYTNDYLATSPTEGSYSASTGTDTITYLVKVPANALSVTVAKAYVTNRFIISAFRTKPSGGMSQTKHVRNDGVLELTLANLDSNDAYVAIYITSNSDDVPTAVNFTVRKMLPV